MIQDDNFSEVEFLRAEKINTFLRWVIVLLLFLGMIAVSIIWIDS